MGTEASERPRRACFSFAAYAKNVIDHLKACHIPVEKGLTDGDFEAVESTLGFTFPPDLRSILQEGLPVGRSFPNWRSSSWQQLGILVNLPILGLSKEVSRNNFWVGSWGEKPREVEEAMKLANGFLKKAPVLVPIYGHFYIPLVPSLAGNPVFYVTGGDVRVWSFDVAGFFQEVDFGRVLKAPAWAATEARRVAFWTEVAEERGRQRRWGDLGGCLEEARWTLREGGWREEEVREMTMMDGGDGEKGPHVRWNREGVVRHLQVVSEKLLRAGWSTEDVVDSLGLGRRRQQVQGVEPWLDFQPSKDSLRLETL
ncbi:uncharacterized protein LOC127809133 [Diospyros lotus]|uniref:uncharacterized protein LOC127809133 n=1 Tax=Diospyros lotus TaxID=55363 RepID=UPI0022526744|nr:uncharacterized protein LOC127809133 [Diospyros lotus]